MEELYLLIHLIFFIEINRDIKFSRTVSKTSDTNKLSEAAQTKNFCTASFC